MAIGTFDELKTAAANWLVRSDLTSRIPEFVSLAESRINRDLIGRQDESDVELTGTLSSRNLALSAATRFGSPIALFLTTFGDQQMLKPMVSGAYEQSTTNGTPHAWSIDGTNIELDCPCDQAHTFLFRYRSTLDIASTTTNWLLTAHPDVYLYAVLTEGFGFARNVPAAQMYDARFKEAVEQVGWNEARSKSVATLSVDPALTVRGGFDINSGDYRA
jgi:hypothetical protein